MQANTSSIKDFLIVIPAYHEKARLPSFLHALAESLTDTPYVCRVLVVDDGSGAEEQSALTALLAELAGTKSLFLPPLLLPVNHGKGAAIRAGWSAHAHDYRWLGFADADGATSATEIRRVFDLVCNHPRPSAIFGSRIRMLGRKVTRSPIRHWVGRIFATAVASCVCPGIYDSQCGFKILPVAMWSKIAGALREPGFAFDVELLAALHHHGLPVEETPIDWTQQPGSRVRFVRDGWRMLQATLRIRRRYRQ